MPSSHFALFLIILALSWQSRGFAQPPVPPPLTSTHPDAAALLDSNIKALTRPEGVEVKFTQAVGNRKEGAKFAGRVVTASNNRTLVEVDFKQVGRTGAVKLVCDGTTFHRFESLPELKQRVSYTLKDLQEALDKLATSEAERVAKLDVEKEQQGVHGFAGVSAMVKDLKSHMFFGQPLMTKLELPGKGAVDVKVIEGRWTPEVLETIAPVKKGNDPNQPDQRYLWNEKKYFFNVPRLAKLYFEAASGNLVRLELLGVVEAGGPDIVLTTTDLQSITPLTTLDAKLFQPRPEEMSYKEIQVDLATMVKNRHAQTMNLLKMQQQLQGGAR